MTKIIDQWLNYKEAAKALEQAPYRPAYILTGEERFLLKQIKTRL